MNWAGKRPTPDQLRDIDRLLAAIDAEIARRIMAERERESRREEYVARVLVIAAVVGGLIVLALALYKVAGR